MAFPSGTFSDAPWFSAAGAYRCGWRTQVNVVNFFFQEGKLSYEEAILARQSLIKENQEKVQEMKDQVCRQPSLWATFHETCLARAPAVQPAMAVCRLPPCGATHLKTETPCSGRGRVGVRAYAT